MEKKKQNRKRGICNVCGRASVITKGLCKKHYEQLLKYGKCLDTNPRTRYDKNEYIIHGDYTEVYTYNNKNEHLHTFLIDTEDLPLLFKCTWGSNYKGNKGPYLCNMKYGLFHRIIMGNPNSTVDHINRNTLDNRKNNLRVASYSEQNLNRVYHSTRFNIRGIDIHRDINRKKRYMARLYFNKKQYRSPWYETYEEAVYCRYLLEQLSPIKIYNPNIEEVANKLSEDKKIPILKWFKNRFKDRV